MRFREGITAIALSATTLGCVAATTSDSDAEKMLEERGFDDIHNIDEDVVMAEFYCGDNYGTSFEFEAYRSGQEVKGRLCIPEFGELFIKPSVQFEPVDE